MLEAIKTGFQYLVDWLLTLIDWGVGWFLNIPKQVFADMLGSLGEWIRSWDVLGTYGPQACSGLSSMPSAVAYFLGMIQFSTGLSLIMGAYLMRFLIRRIPIIG